MVEEWNRKIIANIQELRSLLGGLFHMVQCSHPPGCLSNAYWQPYECVMPCGPRATQPRIKKNIAWFLEYLPCTYGVYIIDKDHRQPVHLLVDAYASEAGTLCEAESYHTQFPPSVWEKHHSV